MNPILFVTFEPGNLGWSEWATQLGRSHFYLINPNVTDLLPILPLLPGVDVIFSPSFPKPGMRLIPVYDRSKYGSREVYSLIPSFPPLSEVKEKKLPQPESPADIISKIASVYGPKYLSILTLEVPKSIIILFGEQHRKKEGGCPQSYGSSLSIKEYLSLLARATRDITFNLFLEEGADEKSESKHFRVIPVDIRPKNDIAVVAAMILRMAKAIPILNEKSIADPDARKLVDIIQEKLTPQKIKMDYVRAGGNIYLQDVLPLIGNAINSVPQLELKAHLQERYENLLTFFETEYPKVATGFFDVVQRNLDSYSRGGRIDLKQWTQAIHSTLRYREMQAEIMNLFTLASMLGSKSPIIFYGGASHSKNFRDFFISMGYREVFVTGSIKSDPDETNCISVPEYSELMGWLKRYS